MFNNTKLKGAKRMNKYFYCYSWPLKEFLVQNGEFSIVSGRHLKTDKQYWVFDSTEKLNSLLTEWKLRKQ